MGDSKTKSKIIKQEKQKKMKENIKRKNKPTNTSFVFTKLFIKNGKYMIYLY